MGWGWGVGGVVLTGAAETRLSPPCRRSAPEVDRTEAREERFADTAPAAGC